VLADVTVPFTKATFGVEERAEVTLLWLPLLGLSPVLGTLPASEGQEAMTN